MLSSDVNGFLFVTFFYVLVYIIITLFAAICNYLQV